MNKIDLRSSGTLRNVQCESVTDVSVAASRGTDKLSRNVGK